jgi:hypothetical protein
VWKVSHQNDELERLTRLRERQIQARDPKAKEKESQRRVTARRRKLKRKTTIQGMMRDMLGDMPYKLWGALIGAGLGFVISIALALLVEASWTALVGLAAVIILALVGFFFGHSFDWRAQVRDEMKDR